MNNINRINDVFMSKRAIIQAWKSEKLFADYPTDGIVVKINSR